MSSAPAEYTLILEKVKRLELRLERMEAKLNPPGHDWQDLADWSSAVTKAIETMNDWEYGTGMMVSAKGWEALQKLARQRPRPWEGQ